VKRIATALLIVVGILRADREPSPFEGTYNVTRTNLATGEKFTEELRISWFGGYYLFEDIQGGGGGELLEQEGIEYAGWMAAASTEYGGSVGLYRMSGDGITGIELYIPDTTFYTITTQNAEPLELKVQWARGLYEHFVFADADSSTRELVMELSGESKLWVMKSTDPTLKMGYHPGYGLSSGNGVAMLFQIADTAVLRLYTITGGNLEGRWLSTYWDDEASHLIERTGPEEVLVQKIYK
jgi:hypothetical protein